LRAGIGGTAGALLVAASVQLAAAAAADAAPDDPTSGDSSPFAYLETDFDNFVQAENTDITGLIDLLPNAFTGVVTTTGDAVSTAFTDFGDLEFGQGIDALIAGLDGDYQEILGAIGAPFTLVPDAVVFAPAEFLFGLIP